MGRESTSSPSAGRSDRTPPYSEEAERGVLGSILLDSSRVLDLCIESRLVPDSFYVPAHVEIFDAMREMSGHGKVIDVLTLGEVLKMAGRLEAVGGAAYLNQLVDATPTAAHAEHYIDIVRQKDLLRRIISCARNAETECYGAPDGADQVLSRTEQSFMEIAESQRNTMVTWTDAIKEGIRQIEKMLDTRRGLAGISTGYASLDDKLHGLRNGEMIVLAARPSMGKTSLALNIAENVALGKRDVDHQPHSVGVFSLEMSHESLVMRMLCAHAQISMFNLTRGFLPQASTHGKIMQAASVLSKAPIVMDDSGGLDILELRSRARRMKLKHNVSLIVIDYLQLMGAKERSREGRQQETAHISQNLKAMAKELKIPVLVLSQLSRAPEQRGGNAKPKLSDLRDSGAIEQDADVVCMLRRPCMYDEDPDHGDESMAVVDIAKHRNGPTGEVIMNFDKETMCFSDRAHGVDGAAGPAGADAPAGQLP